MVRSCTHVWDRPGDPHFKAIMILQKTVSFVRKSKQRPHSRPLVEKRFLHALCSVEMTGGRRYAQPFGPRYDNLRYCEMPDLLLWCKNKAVKRNIERFPERFMFQLAEEENLLFQNGISSWGGTLSYPLAGKRFLHSIDNLWLSEILGWKYRNKSFSEKEGYGWN